MDKLLKIKDEGNQLFKNKNLNEAIVKFQQVIRQIEKDQSKQYLTINSESSKLYIISLINAAFASINLKQVETYDQAINYCDKALAIDPKNVKGLYRRGLAKKEKAEKIEIETVDKAKVNYHELLGYYESAKIDFENLTIVDKQNQMAKKNLAQVIKNIYRVTVAAGDEVDLTTGLKKEEQTTKPIVSPYQIPADQPKKKTLDMTKIMKQYKVDEVTSMVQHKIYDRYLLEDLPKLKSDFEKAVRTLEKSQQTFIKFIYRLDEVYLKKIDPSFDSLANLVSMVLKKGEGEQAKLSLLAFRNQRSFGLYWKSLLPKEKDEVRKKWVDLGLNEDQLK